MNNKIKTKKPYILNIKKIKNNNLIDDPLYLSNFKEQQSPLSGSELDYNPKLWNNNNSIKNSHNCYTYSLGKIVNGLKNKAQPGYASGFDYISNSNFNCKSFKKRLEKDSPASYLEKFDNKCLPGFYKIFLAIDPKNDYHWWRQNSDQKWSHKPGSSNVTNLDASNELIDNPVLSNRKFTHRNYHKPCFFACIYSDLSRSLDKIYSL